MRPVKSPFEDLHSIASSELFSGMEIAKIEEQKRFLDEIIGPLKQGLECQKEIDRIRQLNSVSSYSQSVAKLLEQQTVESRLFTGFDSINSIQKQYENLGLDVSRSDIWQSALEKQRSLFEVPSHIKEMLEGINLGKDLFTSIRGFADYERVGAIESILNQGTLYRGEYEFIGEEDDDEAENRPSHIILPEDLEQRFQSVNFLPIRLFRKVVNDPSLLRTITPRDFEYFVAELIEKLGFEGVDVTPRSNDGGRDIVATKRINDIPLLFAFECKQNAENRKIQLGIMRALLGTVSQCDTKANIGVLVTTSSFTSGARSLIASEALLDGKDFEDLVGWINEIKNK